MKEGQIRVRGDGRYGDDRGTDVGKREEGREDGRMTRERTEEEEAAGRGVL